MTPPQIETSLARTFLKPKTNANISTGIKTRLVSQLSQAVALHTKIYEQIILIMKVYVEFLY